MEAGVGSLLFWGSLAFALVIAGVVAAAGQPLADRARQGPRRRARDRHPRWAVATRGRDHRGAWRSSSARRCFAELAAARRGAVTIAARCARARRRLPATRVHALRPPHHRHGLGRHGGGRVRLDARGEGRGRRARPPGRRLPVDGLRAVQGAARVGARRRTRSATPTPTVWRRSARAPTPTASGRGSRRSRRRSRRPTTTRSASRRWASTCSRAPPA